MAEENTELKLEEVTIVAPEELTEDQTNFLKENTEKLTDEQKETYKDAIKKEDEVIDPEKIIPETRTKEEKKEDDKEKKKDGEEDDEDIDPEDDKTIGKIVDRKMKVVSDQLKDIQGIKDEREVDSFIASKPEFGKYKPAIMKYLQHPAYKNIPVYNIASIVASKDLQAMGAQKERDAQKKTKDTQVAGGTVRKPGGKVDWHSASKADFDAQRAKVLGHQG